MPSRELTDEEKERLLSQEEVNELEEGTEVMVKWQGGNGPHRYTIGFHPKVEHPYVLDENGELDTPLDYVGADRPRTRVLLPEDANE